ncbi:MAG: hypothetical protein Q7V19_08890 [Bacteroidales bacterium]|nr:hypothetical protein [Bacteroidales bacterium]
MLLDGDDPKTGPLLTEPDIEQFRTYLGKQKYVFIDEAQRNEGIGLTMKIITDRLKTMSYLQVAHPILICQINQ